MGGLSAHQSVYKNVENFAKHEPQNEKDVHND